MQASSWRRAPLSDRPGLDAVKCLDLDFLVEQQHPTQTDAHGSGPWCSRRISTTFRGTTGLLPDARLIPKLTVNAFLPNVLSIARPVPFR